MARRDTNIFEPEIVKQAIRDSFPKLDPRSQVKNPVMFIVEIGSVITTVIFFLDIARGTTFQLWFVASIAVWLWLTVLFANFAEAIAEGPRQGAGERPARDPDDDRREAPHGERRDRGRAGAGAAEGRHRRRRRRRDHPRRRRDHRRRRLGGRVGDHGRVGAGDPRGGRRPLRRDGRHAPALGPARDRGHAGARASRSWTG